MPIIGSLSRLCLSRSMHPPHAPCHAERSERSFVNGDPAKNGENRPKRSGLAALRVPEFLEVGDQRRAEVAKRLLAGIERGVLAEGVEWLGGEAQRAPVADHADRARGG